MNIANLFNVKNQFDFFRRRAQNFLAGAALAAAVSADAQTPVTLNLRDVTGAAVNFTTTFTAQTLAGANYPNLILSTPITVTPTNGVITTNLIEGPYAISFVGFPKTIYRYVPGLWATNIAGVTLPVNLADPRWALSGFQTILIQSNLLGGGGGTPLAGASGTNAPIVLLTNNYLFVGTNYEAAGAAFAATNGFPWSSLYDAAGAAQSATNSIGIASGLAAFVPTNRFLSAGAGGVQDASLLTNLVLNSSTIAGASIGGDLTFTNRSFLFTNWTAPRSLNLQAMLDALPRVSDQSNYAGGGKIEIPAGVYFVGTNFLNVTKPFKLELSGSGAGVTALVITNGSGETPGFNFFCTNGNQLSLYIHDLFLCTLTDVTNAILGIHGVAQAQLNRLTFAPWSFLLAANGEVGGHWSSANTNTIGLWLDNGNGQGITSSDLNFIGMHIGLVENCDHYRNYGYMGIEVCGQDTVVAQPFLLQNSWPTNLILSTPWGTTPTMPLAIGCGIMIPWNMFQDSTIEGVHTFNTSIEVINADRDDSQYDSKIFHGGVWSEGAAFRSLTLYTNSGPLIFEDTFPFHGNNIPDYLLSFGSNGWTYITTPPPNVIGMSHRGIGTNTMWQLSVGGTIVSTWTQSGQSVSSITGPGTLRSALATNTTGVLLTNSVLFVGTNYDALGAAQAATNSIGIASGLAAFAPTNRFLSAGAGGPRDGSLITNLTETLPAWATNYIDAASQMVLSNTLNARSLTINSNLTTIRPYQIWGGPTNSLLLDGGSWLYLANGNCAVTQVVGNLAGSYLASALDVSNATASPITLSLRGMKIASGATNLLSIPAGGVGHVIVRGRGAYTNAMSWSDQ